MPGIRGATVLDDLPESIIVEEILVRLPSKDVLRCRAVRKSWRSATSAPDFLVAHHRRQPVLPLINMFPKFPECYYSKENGDEYDCFVAFRGAVAGAERNLWPVVRTSRTTDSLQLEAACDGLLVVSVGLREKDYFICNPANRQYAPLLQLPRCPIATIRIAGFYRHHPSEEFRVLYWMRSEDMDQVHYNVLAVGSDDPRSVYNYREKTSDASWPAMPRSVDQALLAGLLGSSYNPPVFYHGNLHWDTGRCSEITADIMVFDTVAEKFRWMRRPPAASDPRAWLLEFDGALAMWSTVDGVHLDFSLMQDYESEVWTFKLRMNLSAVEVPLQRPDGLAHNSNCPRIVMVNDREVLTNLIRGHLLHCNIDGNLLGSVESKDADYLGVTSSSNGCFGGDALWLTSHLLQESLFPVPSIEMQEQDGVSKPCPFILAS